MSGVATVTWQGGIAEFNYSADEAECCAGTVAGAACPTLVVIAGIKGNDGIDGAGGAPIILASAEAISAGMAAYVDSATNQFKKARADNFNTSTVAGLAQADAAIGFPATVKRDVITLADWTSATGAALLSVSSTYFLSPTTAGGLTLVAPVAGGQSITRIGQALSTTTMLVEIGEPYQL